MDDAILVTMLRERREKRERLQAQLATIDVELRALEELWTRANGGLTLSRRPRQSDESDDGSVRERALKKDWVEMLRFVGGRPNHEASLDQMMEFSDHLGLGIARNTLRSQTSIYVERGWLDRVTQGTFRLTRSGAEKCGFPWYAASEAGGDTASTETAEPKGSDGSDEGAPTPSSDESNP